MATCKISKIGSYIDIARTKHAPSMKRESPTWANLSRPRPGPDDYYIFISANTFLLSVYRRELMWCDVMWCDVAASVPTGKLSRRRSEWFPGAPSAACSTSGYCTWVCLLFMLVFFDVQHDELRKVKTLRSWIVQNQKEKCGGGRRVSVQTSSTTTLCYSFWFKNGNLVLHQFKLYMIFLKKRAKELNIWNYMCHLSFIVCWMWIIANLQQVIYLPPKCPTTSSKLSHKSDFEDESIYFISIFRFNILSLRLLLIFGAVIWFIFSIKNVPICVFSSWGETWTITLIINSCIVYNLIVSLWIPLTIFQTWSPENQQNSPKYIQFTIVEKKNREK